MDVWFVFDKDRHLAGLNVKPSQHANALAPRPQHPKPPFDYDAREVSYDNARDKTHLAGTLTVPKGAGPFAAVLLVTGSGTQDRDETIFGHKPFLVIADHLTRHGIAVLRVDDPGAGGSTGDLAGATIESHARDAEAGIAFLKTQKEIDPTRIGVIGHSEGGLIAAIVASQSKDVAFVVSLAGPGVPGSTINLMQVESSLRSRKNLPEPAINEILTAQKKIVSLVMEGAEDRVLQAALDDALVVQQKHTGESGGRAGAGALKVLTSPWFKSFLKLDPQGYWRNVKVPVLALNGSLDMQVAADVNLREIQAALRKGKNKNVQIEKLAGLNHLFQPAKTGLVDEYGTISTTFDPKALDLMTSWLEKRSSRAK
ncbi:MAG TPA: alpha/beta fold hydrolase [Kofleriaceae bacterium]|nr:alpha/beta fold hydrolase [Kofleriaceae bacterium]